VCSALIAKEEQLNELDRGSGDGDCGSTLKTGVAGREEERKRANIKPTSDSGLMISTCIAIQENLSSIDWDDPQQALLSLASIVEKNMGGSSGAVS
jgi:dihydroxyacetone kinase